MAAASDQPVRIAIVDDYEIVVRGVARMLDPFRDRIAVVELAADEPVEVDVDVALFDTFAQPEGDRGSLELLVENPHAGAVAVFTWCVDPAVVDVALDAGAKGYLAKTLSATELVDAIEAINDGKVVVQLNSGTRQPPIALDWPGRDQGLTQREAEVVALVTQGHSNVEIATMMYLSINTVKFHIRSAYRKMGVSRRSQALLWGIAHGFGIDRRRIDGWR